MKPVSSWVIVNKGTGLAVFETFHKATADAINERLYRAVPILQYLISINGKQKP